MWSLDVHPSEQQLAVGGVSAKVHLFRIGGDTSIAGQAEPSVQGTHTKEVGIKLHPRQSVSVDPCHLADLCWVGASQGPLHIW